MRNLSISAVTTALWNSSPVAIESGMTDITIFLVFRTNNQKDIWTQVYVGLAEILIKKWRTTSGIFVTHTANKLQHATAARAPDARPHVHFRLMSPF